MEVHSPTVSSLSATIGDLTESPFSLKFRFILPSMFGSVSNIDESLLTDASLTFPMQLTPVMDLSDSMVSTLLYLYRSLSISTFCTLYYLLEAVDEDLEQLGVASHDNTISYSALCYLAMYLKEV